MIFSKTIRVKRFNIRRETGFANVRPSREIHDRLAATHFLNPKDHTRNANPAAREEALVE
jgi:hypothetical protein